VLRSAGLRNDTFGEAVRFFGLPKWQLHAVVCSCHFGETMAAEDAAARVRCFGRQTFTTFAQRYVLALALLGGIALLSIAI
jgi:hypothetical protein